MTREEHIKIVQKYFPRSNCNAINGVWMVDNSVAIRDNFPYLHGGYGYTPGDECESIEDAIDLAIQRTYDREATCIEFREKLKKCLQEIKDNE